MLDFILESSSIILYRGLGTSPRLMASAGICKSFLAVSYTHLTLPTNSLV